MKTVLAEAHTVQQFQLIKFFCLLLLAFAANVLAKPGAAISLRSPAAYQLAEHSVEQLNVEFSLPGNAVNLKLQMQTEGNIAVLDPELSLEFTLEAAQTNLLLPVQIESGESGTDYLMFNLILTYENGVSEARSIGLRLQVGEEALTTNLQKPTGEERIKVLPAQEEVIYQP